jgi:hypothetical protein
MMAKKGPGEKGLSFKEPETSAQVISAILRAAQGPAVIEKPIFCHPERRQGSTIS